MTFSDPEGKLGAILRTIQLLIFKKWSIQHFY